MLRYLKLFIFVLVLGCHTEKPRTSGKGTDSLRSEILISSGQMSSYEAIKIGDFEFQLALDEHSDTTYLGTTDTHFSTLEGFRVGTSFGVLPEKLKARLAKEAGWGYFITLDSNWSLAFCEGNSCTDRSPTDSSVVKWIFKRK